MTVGDPNQLDRAPAADVWWRHAFRMFQTNLREVDVDFDVEAALDAIEAYGANAWLLSVGGIIANHPSDLPFQTVNPRLANRPSGDLVGDALTAARRRAVRLLGRMDFSKVTTTIASQHPEWCYISVDGELQEYQGLVSVCPSGAYYQERAFDIIDEIADRYPLDGFFFNWFGFSEVDYSSVYRGPCHCVSCLRAFKQYSGGMPHPRDSSSPSYETWRRFAAQAIADLSERLRTHIADRLPEAALLLGPRADIVFHEANNALHRVQWPFATEQAVSVARSWRPDVPVLVNSVAFIDMPYRMAPEEPERLAHYQVQTIARGGNPSTYIMGVPGQIPYQLDAASEVIRHHQRWQQVYDRIDPIATVALVEPDRLLGNADDRRRRTEEFRGLYLSLQQSHVPFDVVPQSAVDQLDLGRYRLVVLGDLGPLASTTVSALDHFVSAGGSLVCTAGTAVTDDGTVQLAALPAQKARAVIDSEELLKSTYIAPREPTNTAVFSAATNYTGPVLPVYGSYRFFDWTVDSDRHGVLLARAPFGPPEKAYGNVAVDHPGWVVGASGSGRAVLVPWTVGRAYHDLGLTSIRDIFLDAVREVLGAPRLTAQAPEQVELVVGQSGRDTIAHLINFSGWRGNNFGPLLPCADVRLSLHAGDDQDPPSCHALVADRPCVVERQGDRWIVDIPEFALFEAIRIESPQPLSEGSRP